MPWHRQQHSPGSSFAAAVVTCGALLAGCRASGQVTEAAAVAPKGPPVATVTELAVATVAGPAGARQRRSTTVTCPPGSTMLGGGADAYLATGHAPNPSLRLVGTVPDTTVAPFGWQALVATGGVEQRDSRVSVLAVCGRHVGIAEPTVIVNGAPGPTAAASAAEATATCPGGSVLVGGGAAVGLTDGRAGPPQYFVSASFPSTPAGVPATTGTAPTAWSAIGALGGAPMTGGQIKAVAVCVPGRSVSVNVVVRTALGPTRPQSARQVIATCPTHSILVGGGVYTGAAKLKRPLQGLHLRGSFPSGRNGSLDAAGVAPNSWSAIANSGGVIAVGARTTSFALCSSQSPSAGP